MFGSIGPTEILLIMALALLFFGPKRLPEIGRSLGGALREFRRASQNFMSAVNNPDLLLEDEEEDRPPAKAIEFPSPPPVEFASGSTFESQPYGSDFRTADEEVPDGGGDLSLVEGSLVGPMETPGEPERKV